MMKKIAMLMAACTVMLGAWAATETVGDYTWTYRIIDNTAEIYNGSYAAISPSPTGVVTIPSILGKKPVTSIGNYAFSRCSGFTSVTIPNSVTNIGYSAFWNCSGLTSVTIPDSVKSIGEEAFASCRGLTSVTIGNGVTSIVPGAFNGCSGLTNVAIPDSVTNIGYAAFIDCSGLMSVTIGNGVTSIAGRAFQNCTGITSMTIPDSVISIGVWAFHCCTGITNMTIGNSVTSIEYEAFECCSGLTSVTIPDSVTNIGEYAFADCSGLTNVTISSSVTDISYCAFDGCSGLTSVVIPDPVTNIEDHAFASCSGLTSVTIGNGVTNIGDYAFSWCSGLTNLLFRGNAPSVGSHAFYSVKSGCTAYVRKGSTGWGVDIPGTWNGINIQYLSPEVEIGLANDKGDGTVELNANDLSDTVEVASGVTLVVKGADIDSAALAAKIIPKPHEGGQDTSFFKVKSKFVDGGISLAVVLDEDAVKPDDTAAEVVASTNMAAIDSAAEGANVSVKLSNAKPGLYYGVAVAGDVAGLEKAAENVSLSRAGADGVEVPVVKPAGGAAFFKVVVSDRAQ